MNLLLSQPLETHDVSVVRAGLVDLDLSMVFMLGLFLLVFFLLNRILLQPMLDMFDQRHALTGGTREEADKAVADAETRIAEYETRVGQARREAIMETKRIRSEAALAERAMLDGVREETNAQVDQGIQELQVQAAEADSQLETAANDLGKQIASHLLGGVA